MVFRSISVNIQSLKIQLQSRNTRIIPQHHQHRQLQLPPSNSADDSSVISIQSALHQPEYHDTKLNVKPFKAKWLKEGAPAKIWLSQIIGELASKLYYHPLLTKCKTKINYDATGDDPNATLFSVIHNKLSESYRTMLCLNCNFTTGT